MDATSFEVISSQALFRSSSIRCMSLCYLWWPGSDLSKEPKTYQMLVHLFWAKALPSVAGYALRKTADNNKQDLSREAFDAVFKDFYVDDLLKSFAH